MKGIYIKEIENNKTPNDIYVQLKNYYPQETKGFILESGMDHEKLGRYSFIGMDPIEEISWDGIGENPFDQIERKIEKNKRKIDIDFPFIGGGVGYISYDYKNYIEEELGSLKDREKLVEFYFYDGIIAIDHQKEKTYLIALGIKENSKETIERLEKILKTNDLKKEKVERLNSHLKITSNTKKEDYLESIRKVKNYIREGDVYQINYTHKFTAKGKVEGLKIYENLRKINPAPFSCYLKCSDLEVISSSPERFLQVIDGKVETRPMKGTRPRGINPGEDEKLINELKNSEKDKSELLMIIDLMRNDLSRVSQPGSVKVTEIFAIEKYPTVLQMVGNIEGKLKDKISFKKLINKTFPGGSITGAPKIRAMEIIEELEVEKRGIYTGAIGYFSYNGNIDLNIAIRTIVKEGEEIYYQVGGGIVWDSNEEEEYKESLTKGKALLKAIKLTIGGGEDG